MSSSSSKREQPPNPSDLKDALEHILGEVLGLDKWPAGLGFDAVFIRFSVKRLLRDLERGDPYEDWGGYEYGSLKGKSRPEIVEELRAFRKTDAWTKRSSAWLDSGIPPIFVLRDKNYGAILADGRGRFSLAVGMALKEIEGFEIRLFERR